MNNLNLLDFIKYTGAFLLFERNFPIAINLAYFILSFLTI